MKYIREIAIGVGIGPETAVYAAVENKHLLLGDLPQPEDLKKYAQSPQHTPWFYFIDKGIVVFRGTTKGNIYGIDLKTRRKIRIGERYIEDFLPPESDSTPKLWKKEGKGTLILYIFKILHDYLGVYLYEQDISLGIRILEYYLQNLEILLKIIRAKPENVRVVAYYMDSKPVISIYFAKPKLVDIPGGYDKIIKVSVKCTPEEEFTVALLVETYSYTQGRIKSSYIKGYTLKDLLKIADLFKD